MKIKIADIKPSSQRVRKELNLDKLDDLAASMKETGGLVVPVKVRENGKAYEVVYGHRRVEAARLADFTEIECIVEGLDDNQAFLHALIENMVREDMNDVDKRTGLRILHEQGLSWEEVGAKFGKSGKWAGNIAGMTDVEAEIILTGKDLTAVHVIEARAGTETQEDAEKVLKKAAREGLTKRQTRTVAEEYKKAKQFGGSKMAAQVLKTSYARQELDPYYQTTTPSKKATPVVTTPPKKKEYSWLKDDNIIRAYSSIANIGPVLEYMKHNRQRKTKDMLAVARQVRKYLMELLGKVDTLIEETEKWQAQKFADN